MAGETGLARRPAGRDAVVRDDGFVFVADAGIAGNVVAGQRDRVPAALPAPPAPGR